MIDQAYIAAPAQDSLAEKRPSSDGAALEVHVLLAKLAAEAGASEVHLVSPALFSSTKTSDSIRSPVSESHHLQHGDQRVCGEVPLDDKSQNRCVEQLMQFPGLQRSAGIRMQVRLSCLCENQHKSFLGDVRS